MLVSRLCFAVHDTSTPESLPQQLLDSLHLGRQRGYLRLKRRNSFVRALIFFLAFLVHRRLQAPNDRMRCMVLGHGDTTLLVLA